MKDQTKCQLSPMLCCFGRSELRRHFRDLFSTDGYTVKKILNFFCDTRLKLALVCVFRTNFRKNLQDSIKLSEAPTLVPEVFLEPRIGEEESRIGKKKKPSVTLDLNLTFMQTPAVKRVKIDK